jgi:hypothetical protein
LDNSAVRAITDERPIDREYIESRRVIRRTAVIGHAERRPLDGTLELFFPASVSGGIGFIT